MDCVESGEQYDTKSNYLLIVYVTNSEISNVFLDFFSTSVVLYLSFEKRRKYATEAI